MKWIGWLSVVIWVKCTHAITHVRDMLMSMCKLGNSNSLWEFQLQGLCRGGMLSRDKIGTCICWVLYESVRRLYCTESSWIRVLYEIVSWSMIYIIYDSGVFSFMLSQKNLCMCSWYFTLWSWFNLRKNISRSNYVFNNGI